MHGRTRTQAGTLDGWRVLAAASSLLAMLALGPGASAQDGADPQADPGGRRADEAPAQPAEEAGPATPPAPAESATPPAPAEGAAPSAPAGSAAPRAAGEASDDVFVPTEEIAADEEVVFPVDI